MNKHGIAVEGSDISGIRSTTLKKYNILKGLISKMNSAAIAFSGGVDSTFLLKVCSDVQGFDALAVTAKSETFPKRELEQAKFLARQMPVTHVIIQSEELNIPGFTDNPPDRCFMCKNELFSKVKQLADEYGLAWVFDGSNADDADDFRPGRKAAKDLGVRSPLEESKLGKKEIRVLSKAIGLPTWNKPSYACLSSRFPYFSKISRAALKQVEKAESYLSQFGMRVFRVRHHGTMARLELGKDEMRCLWQGNTRNQIVNYLKSIGYSYIAVDLEGYRSGSMNETLSDKEKYNTY
ncbi:MAG: ATP-dependent sacrificial sulfur transferase LarE [Deltaproteobacteria bacterium]|nr:ATP-dependent sacrificial sulfur transferase LarE [Deltaproteobacteria bacterium]